MVVFRCTTTFHRIIPLTRRHQPGAALRATSPAPPWRPRGTTASCGSGSGTSRATGPAKGCRVAPHLFPAMALLPPIPSDPHKTPPRKDCIPLRSLAQRRGRGRSLLSDPAYVPCVHSVISSTSHYLLCITEPSAYRCFRMGVIGCAVVSFKINCIMYPPRNKYLLTPGKLSGDNSAGTRGG